MTTQLYLFTEYGVANTYGIGTYLWLVREALKNNPAFEITIVEIMSDRKRIECEYEKGIRHLYIPYLQTSKDKKSYCRSIFYLLHYRYITGEGDIIFHFNFMVGRNLLALLKSHYPKSKLVYTIHYTLSNISGIPSVESDEAERAFMGDCDLLIAISEHRYRYLVEQCCFSPKKVRLLPHGIYDEFGLVFKNSFPAFSQLGLPHERIILYAGRLDENKRVSLLVEAFGRVLKVMSDVHLVIAGEGLSLSFMNVRNCPN